MFFSRPIHTTQTEAVTTAKRTLIPELETNDMEATVVNLNEPTGVINIKA